MIRVDGVCICVCAPCTCFLSLFSQEVVRLPHSCGSVLWLVRLKVFLWEQVLVDCVEFFSSLQELGGWYVEKCTYNVLS